MHHLTIAVPAITHQIYATLLTVFGAEPSGDPDPVERDRGAVSLEQVLWFVAAGVAVAVIAGILWATIREQAETDPDVPTAP